MRGPCAKRQTRCVILGNNQMRYEGTNDCENPQDVCPRQPGEGYEKCRTICRQRGHAEQNALRAAGAHARNGTATLHGHYYICEECGRALAEAGVIAIKVVLHR